MFIQALELVTSQGFAGRADTAALPPGENTLALDQLGSSSLVERCGELEGLYRRRSIDHIRKRLQHLRVGRVVIGRRICFGVPEAIGDRFRAFGCDQKTFIAESLLLAQDRENLGLGDAVEFCSGIGLKL